MVHVAKRHVFQFLIQFNENYTRRPIGVINLIHHLYRKNHNIKNIWHKMILK